MATYTVFVQNISYSAVPTDLGQALEKFGKVVKAIILTDTFRGRRQSRGIGFVQFETEEQMNAAIAATGTVDINNRKLFITKARPQQPRVTAFIANIAPGTTKEIVLEAFKAYNPADARIVHENQTGERARKGFGFVKFATEEDLKRCVEEHKTIQINGEETVVRFARRAFDAKPRRFNRRFNRRTGRRNVRKAATE